MPALKITLENAKQDKLFYVVANAVVYRKADGRCLILKRSEREKVHPGKYCVLGGKLEWSQLDISKPTRMNGDVYDFENAIENLLAREAKEEAGIEIGKEFFYVNSVAFVRPDGVPSLLIKFAVEYKGGEVKLEKGSFDDFAWVNEEEIKNYDCIKGIAEEIAHACAIFEKRA